jgi:hypothetical protein
VLEARPGRSTPAVLQRRIGSETIVYDRSAHRAHCLGPIAFTVWRSWEAGAPASEIADLVDEETGERVGVVAVELALRRLRRAGLLRRPDGPHAVETPAVGPSNAGRREALRRVATLAGLAVASIAVPAPEAAAATCTRQVGQSCQLSSECCPTGSGDPTCCGQLLRRCLPRSIANCGP